jgi:alpha-tubulin suppressor-like RCC1 family protein
MMLVLVACGGRLASSLSDVADEPPRDADGRGDAGRQSGPADAGPSDASRWVPAPDTGPTDWPALAGSPLASFGDFNCVRTATTTKCWGLGISGQLGDGTVPVESATPRIVAGGPFDDIAVSNHHACGRMHDTLACWGHDYYGEVGHLASGDPASSICDYGGDPIPCFTRPVAVPNLSGVRSVALGFYYSCAILAGGAVSCWGFDQYGQVGVAPSGASNCQGYTCVPAPTTIPGLTGVVQLALSTATTCALRGDGTVWCWGENHQSALGRDTDGGLAFEPPAPVPGLDDARAIASGDANHMCVIRADRTVWCWGLNSVGQAGQPLGSNEVCPNTYVGCINRPTQVPALSDVRALALGYFHSCAITTADALYCWGTNYYGQLGRDPALLHPDPDAGVSFSNVPVRVDLPPVEYAALGEEHTCAMLKDRSVRCWGENGLAQLGVDPKQLASSFVPVTVPGL